MKVAVLGCGPAGLVATHAAVEAGADVRVFSKLRKSELFGAQYLHEPIPGFDPGPSQRINYALLGTIDDYRRKVYGPTYDGSVSPGSLAPGHLAYDIRHTYDQLWAAYSSLITRAVVNPLWLSRAYGRFDVVLNTIPLPSLCDSRRHRFDGQSIWALGDAPSRGQHVPRPYGIEEGDVICNGLPDPPWYRASLIFGHATIEWSYGGANSSPDFAAVVWKPIWNNCDCWPWVTMLGRYGRWQKGVLVHHTYQETVKCLANL